MAITPEQMRACVVCGVVANEPTMRRGRNICRACYAARNRRYKADNREAEHARYDAWRRANPEKIAERDRRYRQRKQAGQGL